MNEPALEVPPLATPQVARPSYVRYMILAWCCSLSMLSYLDRNSLPKVKKEIEESLGIGNQEFGWLIAAFGLSYAIFEVPCGWWGDRVGPRRVLCRIVVCWSIFTALTGCIQQFEWSSGYRLGLTGFAWEVPLVFNSLILLLLLRFLFGACEAGTYPNIAKALRNWFPYRRRGLAQGLLWMCGRWGGAIAAPLILLLTYWFTWRGAFLALGLMGVGWTVCFALWFRDSPKGHPSVNEAERTLIERGVGDAARPAPLDWSAMLRNPTLWFLCLMYFFSNAGWCFFISWDQTYYEEQLHMTGGPLQMAAIGPLFFGGIACLLGGFVTDRQVRYWGRRWGRTLQGSLAYLTGAIFFFLAMLTRNPWLAVPALCLASFMKDFAMACSWSTCIDIGHRYSGTVSGFMNMVGNLGTAVSPPLVAYLARRGDWNLALAYSSGMFFVAAVCWLLINPRNVVVYSAADRHRLQSEGVLAS